jgi:hypothetical protein
MWKFYCDARSIYSMIEKKKLIHNLVLFMLPKLLNYLALGVADEGYSRNVSCTLNLISMFNTIHSDSHLLS